MRENKFRNFAITGVIVFSILFLILFNIYYVFTSPKMIEARKVNNTVQQFEVKNNKAVEFKSRYFLEDAIFTASDDSTLYFFDDEGKLITEVSLSEIDESRLDGIADSRYEEYSIAFALIDESPVYVIVNEKEDVFIDVETFDEILVFRKGIAND